MRQTLLQGIFGSTFFFKIGVISKHAPPYRYTYRG